MLLILCAILPLKTRTILRMLSVIRLCLCNGHVQNPRRSNNSLITSNKLSRRNVKRGILGQQ